LQQKRKYITVFEHQTIKLNQVIGGVLLNKEKLNALQKYYGENGVPYYSLTHNGIRFNAYVGVIQVGNLIIEVLPKADNSYTGIDEKTKWRNILIDMLFAVGLFDIHAPSSSSLKLKSNSILDLYFEIFIKEVEYLLHNGLVKKYRKKEGNVAALKGRLQFGKHIQHNLTHQERFYVSHTIYDVEHKLHFILFKTIRLLKQINTNANLQSRIGALLLNFPEMPETRVTEKSFNTIVYSQKTKIYKKSIEIARLLLLQYHPDVSRGRNDVLTLMFDMNKLWEQFVYVSLRKHRKLTTSITAQTSKYFWKPKLGIRSKIRPDIVLNKDKPDCVVLDTKWKNLNGCNPSPNDLRQMYVYHEYYQARRVALVYPGTESNKSAGAYLHPTTSKEIDKECSVFTFSVESNSIKNWQAKIYTDLENWLNLTVSESII